MIPLLTGLMQYFDFFTPVCCIESIPVFVGIRCRGDCRVKKRQGSDTMLLAIPIVWIRVVLILLQFVNLLAVEVPEIIEVWMPLAKQSLNGVEQIFPTRNIRI